MSRINSTFWNELIVFIVISLVIVRSVTAAPTFDSAVTGLATGWTSSTLYQGDLGVYPGAITADSNDNILLYDKGTGKLKTVTPSGVITTSADLSSLGGVQTIGFQNTRNRLLIVTNGGSLYAYNAGSLTLIKPSGFSGNSMAVNPQDGTFYLGTISIVHYDADGNLLGTVSSFALNISQMALDPTGLLYYSETLLGTISVINLATNTKQTLITGVGIPGTTEPISVALDSQETLYYFPSASGLYRYVNGSSSKVLNSIGGAGNIQWSSSRNAFIQTQGAGANLVEYSPQAGASNLTPYVNAFAIAELTDGTVIIPDSATQNLLKVNSSGMTVFSTNAAATCNAFTRDNAGTVYAGCGNVVYRVGTDSSLATINIFSDNNVVSLAYDSLNNVLIVSTNNNNGSQVGNANIWRLTLTSSPQATLVTSFQGITVNNVLPGVAADQNGNIYILERSSNKIYTIANGSTSSTTFASNVLSSTAVTVPHMLYVNSLNGLLVSAISDYELWPLSNPIMQVFASNAGATDNFATFQTVSGDIVAVHSGQIFSMTNNGNSQSLTTRSDCIFNWAERTYSLYFSPAGAADAMLPPYTYRYYSGTGIYLATSSADSNLWALGPVTGNKLISLGPVSGFLGASGCQ